MTDTETPALPREDLLRAVSSAPEFRDASEDGGSPTLVGHFAVFDQWTEISSAWEGNFRERFAPGAFKKTISDNRSKMRLLFQHGQDPQVGDKPIGAITDMREDDTGAYYEATLFDGIPPLVMDGLRAGQYGASFRFRAMREDIVHPTDATDENPELLTERTIKEAKVMEFGPVTFPAYAGATAGVRSLTDAFILRCFEQDPEKLRSMFEQAQELDAETGDQEDAPPEGDAAVTEQHLAEGRREHEPIRTTPRPSLTSTRAHPHTLDPKECSWRLP
jgi:HK97 family phage prohead protease